MLEKAVLYSRVSTQDQKQNSSLESQIAKARKYAISKGYEIVGEEQDVISGSFVLARSAFNRFIQMQLAGKANVLIVDIPDRLGRGGAIAKCELLVEMNGGRIEYASPGRDESTVEGMALKATDMLVSGIERINIRRRTMSGKIAWAEKGRVIASAYRPYGLEFRKEYDSATGRKLSCDFVLVDEEANIIQQMFEWCVYEGLSPNMIAKRLTRLRIPTLVDKEGGKPKKSPVGTWHRDTVRGILTSPVYKGEWQYRKNIITRIDSSDGVKTQVEQRSEDEIISVDVVPIVDTALWQKAQGQIRESAKRNVRASRFDYLLSGRLRCANCGGSMSGATRVYEGKKKTSINWRYRCIKKYEFGKGAPGSCPTKNIEGRLIEAVVWDALVKLLLNEDRLFGKIKENSESKKASQQVIIHTITGLEVKNQKDGNGLSRLLDLYTMGELEKEIYLSKKREIEHKLKERNFEIIELKKRLIDSSPIDATAEQKLRELQKVISNRLHNSNFEQKQQVLRALRIECIYHDKTGQVTMSGVFGTQTMMLEKEDDSGNGGDASDNAEKLEYQQRQHL